MRFTKPFRTLLFLTFILPVSSVVSGQQPTKPPAQKSSKQKGVHDVISTTFSASCDPAKSADLVKMQSELDLLAHDKELVWADSALLKIAQASVPGTAATVDPKQAYIFHVDHWTSSHVLVSSDWYVYKATGAGKLKPSGFTANGDQLLYGLRRALLIGIEIFDSGVSGPVHFDYKVSAVQGTPENAQALGQLIAALLGLAVPTADITAEVGCSVLAGASFQNGTKRLPFDLNVAESAYDSTSVKDSDSSKGTGGPAQNATPGVADCSSIAKGSPCTLSRTFTSLDKEWWDVGIGVTIPGVRETKYSIVSGSLNKTVTTHTNAYALFDIYPFAQYKTKDSPIPHLAVGLPLTNQTFYRPFFGISENLTGWNGFQKWSGLPTLNFFAGVVYMKTSIVSDSPTTQAELTSDQRFVHATKALFGVEVPVKALISKVGKSKAKNSNAASPSQSSQSAGT